jgi:hypothetical protein
MNFQNRVLEITNWPYQKYSIMHIFDGEIPPFIFARSEIFMQAQDVLHGSQVKVMSAKSFMVLKEIR